MTTTGLYVGRFQPFHNGHLECIKYVLTKVDQLIVVIGSAQYSHTLHDPFTAGERMTMIRLALDEAGVSPAKYMIVPVPDVNVHNIWVSHLLAHAPKFDVVFSNESLTSRLLKEANFKVEKIPYFSREANSATHVRKLILSGDQWTALVPKSVAKYLNAIHGVERIRDLSMEDMPSQP